MIHYIRVDARSKVGKSLLQIAQALSSEKGIEVIDEKKEDAFLIKKMKAALKEGFLNEKEKVNFLKQVKNIAGI